MLGLSSVVPPASDEEDRTPGGRLGGKRFLGGWPGLKNCRNYLRSEIMLFSF